jgi:hypothetical protein
MESLTINAQSRILEHPEVKKKLLAGYKFTSLSPYQDANEDPVFYRLRLHHPEQGKWIRPFHLKDDVVALGEPEFPDGLKLIYNLPGIAKNPDATVWVIEGEKCADTLTALGMIATTSGSASSASSANWAPLKGRRCVMWPDFDKPGAAYAETVTGILAGLGCSVDVIDVAPLKLPESGDVVDWLVTHPGATAADIEALPCVVQKPIDGLIAGSVLTFEDFLKADFPERKMILPWLPAGGLALLSAPRGIGKTMFGLSLAGAITSGVDFMKWSVLNPTGVLYIDGEMAIDELRKRLTMFLPKVPQHPLEIVSHQIVYERHERDLDLSAAEIQTEIFKYLERRRDIGLLILDNASCLLPIREDVSDDWRGSVQPFLIGCRRRSVAVLLVHHTGKGGQQRGTSAREDILDASIILKDSASENNEGAAFNVTFTKSRGAFGETVEPFSAKLIMDNGIGRWETGDEGAGVADRLLRLISDYATEGVTVTEAADELGVSKSCISKTKRRLIEQEEIQAGKRMKLAVEKKFPRPRMGIGVETGLALCK